jgi:cytochrome c oxidase assembly factor CtaG
MMIVASISFLSLLYAAGVWNLWRSAGIGHGITKWHAASFCIAIISLIVALLSPFDELADSLQSAHMGQHLVLILVAPPLLIYGQLHRAVPWAIPHYYRRGIAMRVAHSAALKRLASALTSPKSAFSLHAVALLVWHLPAPYEAAAANDAIHALEHASFLFTALLFWWTLMAPLPFRRLSNALSIPYVVGMSLIGSLIGAVLTFASVPLYDSYLATAVIAGLTPLEDQQLAGLIMWIPGGIAYLVLAAALFIRWMNRVGAEQAHSPALDALEAG